MRIEVLGAVRVDGKIPLGPSERRLLAALLINRPRVVDDEALIRIVWSDGTPTSAHRTLCSKLSRLRTLLGSTRIDRVGHGYRINAERDEVDADRFFDLVADTHGATDVIARARLDQALALWSGSAYEEFAGEPFAYAAANGLDRARLDAAEQRLAAMRSAGECAALIGHAAREILDRDPYREGTYRVLVETLIEGEQRVEALRECRRAREALAQVGLEIGTALCDLEQRALLAHAV